MSRFHFSLATARDDAQLRARMAEDWIKGDISVSFRREPDYFAGCRLQGNPVQIIVCRETSNGRIVGLGSRAVTCVYLNGNPTRTGYLADLRCEPAYRNGMLLARGYRFLRSLHQSDPLPVYYTVIFETNKTALHSLLGARAGLPVYQPSGKILTPALHLDFPRAPITQASLELRRANNADLPAIIRFLNERLATRQYAPVYSEQDFRRGGRCATLAVGNFFIACRGSRIVATLAAWDQEAIRQTHIERYSTMLSALRPLYNLASFISPLKKMPATGSKIPFLYLCCIAIADDDIMTFRILLRFAYNELRKGPWHYAIASLHERDPLAQVLSEYRSIPAAGLLYRVDFDTESLSPPVTSESDDRTPYIEMALA